MSSVKKSPTRKSILKKSGTSRDEANDSDVERNCIMPVGGTANRKGGTTQRPRSLSDLRRDEALKADSTDSTFSLDDLSPNEEIWIMDIPRTIDPRLLEGQNLTFGAKGKLKIGEERYCVVSKAITSTLTCVVGTGSKGNSYKAVNVKPAGLITVRRKLSSTSRSKPKRLENTAVPFPKNLRVRHPLFGAAYKDKVLSMKMEL